LISASLFRKKVIGSGTRSSGRTRRLSASDDTRLTVVVSSTWRMKYGISETVRSGPSDLATRARFHRLIPGCTTLIWKTSAFLRSRNSGSRRTGSSGASAESTWARTLCQLFHGGLSSFMTRLPLT
jgi:hypothetical protein